MQHLVLVDCRAAELLKFMDQNLRVKLPLPYTLLPTLSALEELLHS
jgi:hypothetical protein